MSSYLDAVANGVVIFDGATGTNLQRRDLTLDDFGGPDFEGCVDILSVTPRTSSKISTAPSSM